MSFSGDVLTNTLPPGNKIRKSTVRSNQPYIPLDGLQQTPLGDAFNKFLYLYVRLFCLMTEVEGAVSGQSHPISMSSREFSLTQSDLRDVPSDSGLIFDHSFVQLYLFSCFEKRNSFSKHLTRHLYSQQNRVLMASLFSGKNREAKARRRHPENDFRKQIQNAGRTKNIFYNAKSNLNNFSSELMHMPLIELTFSEDRPALGRALQSNLKGSILFEYKICTNIRKCLFEESGLISDAFFLETGNLFSHFMAAMLDFEFLSIFELTEILQVWNGYLLNFSERVTEVSQDNCFEIIQTLKNLFSNFSDFADLR